MLEFRIRFQGQLGLCSLDLFIGSGMYQYQQNQFKPIVALDQQVQGQPHVSRRLFNLGLTTYRLFGMSPSLDCKSPVITLLVSAHRLCSILIYKSALLLGLVDYKYYPYLKGRVIVILSGRIFKIDSLSPSWDLDSYPCKAQAYLLIDWSAGFLTIVNPLLQNGRSLK